MQMFRFGRIKKIDKLQFSVFNRIFYAYYTFMIQSKNKKHITTPAFLLDQHAQMDFYSASKLKQKSRGEHANHYTTDEVTIYSYVLKVTCTVHQTCVTEDQAVVEMYVEIQYML